MNDLNRHSLLIEIDSFHWFRSSFLFQYENISFRSRSSIATQFCELSFFRVYLHVNDRHFYIFREIIEGAVRQALRLLPCIVDVYNNCNTVRNLLFSCLISCSEWWCILSSDGNYFLFCHSWEQCTRLISNPYRCQCRDNRSYSSKNL